MPQPLSYMAAANVDITIKGSDPENALDLMGHKETGKTGCHPIETSFDATLAWMVKNEDPPVTILPHNAALIEESPEDHDFKLD